MSKPGAAPPGISSGDALILPERHPAYRRREAQPALDMERENLASAAKVLHRLERQCAQRRRAGRRLCLRGRYGVAPCRGYDKGRRAASSRAGRAPHGRCARHIRCSHRYSCAHLLGSVRARDWTGRQENAGRARRTASCPHIAPAPRSAFPSSPCRDGWSARRAPGNSADRTA